MLRFLTVSALLAFTPTVAQAVETVTKSVRFEACLNIISSMASELGTAPVNIVETKDLRMVRFVTSDGSVLVTCSRPDRKMAVTKSPR